MRSLNSTVNEGLGTPIVLAQIVDLLKNDDMWYKSSYELFAQSNFRVWLPLVIISTGIGEKIILNKGLSIWELFQ